ncbi:uncharacterized protein LOC127251040 [Andrographis paniculata]|uniref:uncharacterized protein LOC127251040 n=1 Tax=Andrographis paniculata TaxID=175694 RepID=UPI0021E71676|nr:uncharacterized protein LOC127251040 [Andrographis paniculata]
MDSFSTTPLSDGRRILTAALLARTSKGEIVGNDSDAIGSYFPSVLPTPKSCECVPETLFSEKSVVALLDDDQAGCQRKACVGLIKRKLQLKEVKKMTCAVVLWCILGAMTA